MRKQMVMAAAMVLSSGIAVAQRIGASDAKAYYTFKGCSFIQEGLLCNLTYTPSDNGRYLYYASEFQVVTPDGIPVTARQAKAAGGNWGGTYTVDTYAGVSYQIAVLFDVPKTTRSLALINARGNILRNVPIGGATTAAPTPSSPVINLPTTQAFIGGKAFTVSFTNCKLNSAGAYVCTSTVTPSR